MISKNPRLYIQGVLDRDKRLLAKTITLIESSLPAHRELAESIINQLLPHTGKAVRLGITGVPGAGKSTFIETYGLYKIGKGDKVPMVLLISAKKILQRG